MNRLGVVIFSLLMLLVWCQAQDILGSRHSGHSDIATSNVGVVFDDDEDGERTMMEKDGEAKPSIDNCMVSRHGCCADGRTHAQGPDREGCPERNLIGGCAGTRYGCCEDGRTSASGPEKFGCPEKTLIGGCAGTRYGCCLDGKTAAAGENRYGCPEKYAGGCARTQYGCCADKVTAARGENQLGCPENPVVRCDMTQYGCCEDQTTAATGPDSEGCPERPKVGEISGCQNSRYGCCPDGMTSAEGLNNEGCPSFDSAYCGLDKNSGNCSDYALQWYFENKYGMCRQFWYGGCGGNMNRFGTKEDCESKCVNVGGPARCRLPKVTGPCKASKTRYYFNARSGQCETFIYGGCKANSNNFLTKSQCEVACNGAVSEEAGGGETACSRNPCQYGFKCEDLSDGTHQCECNPDWGENCSRLPSYWCFSDDECASGFSCVHRKRCRDDKCYVYSRCSVDYQRHACQRARCRSNQDCVNDATQREGYVCVDKVDYKRPQAVVLNCAVHEFGCCPDGKMPAHGPNNERCSQDCRTSEFGCCPDERTPASGPNFDGCELEGSADMPCEKSDFGCCDDGIRAAMGPRGEGCQDTTDAETTMEPTRGGVVKCTAAESRQLCTKYEVKWRYDGKLMACKRHWWGGCRDNGNVFETKEECEAECITTVITEPTDEPDFVNICDMPSVVGPCRAIIPRYFYDPRERNCRLFNYGGCSGNENNFQTLEECQSECMADIRRTVSPAPATESPQTTEAPEATLMMSAPATVVEGEELRVTCITTGPIGIRLEWFFDGQPVTEENVEITFNRKRMNGGIEATGQLIIATAMQENSGTYYCRNSELQTKSTSVTVQLRSDITTPPTTSKPFESTMTMSGQSVVYEGNELRITCKARGPTDVGLEWFINGQPVTDNEDVEVTTDIKSLSGGYEITGELIITRARVSNSGTYYCRSADRQLESMVVNVRKSISITTRPTEATTAAPTEEPDETESFINIMGDARVPAGSTLSITCRAVGPRRPSSIEWFINGRYVNPRASIASVSTSRDPRSLNAIVGTFSISNVNETNDGTYYCRSRPYGDIGRMSVKITDDVITLPPTTTTTTTTTTESPDQGSPAEVCRMRWDGGNCYANIPRWFYDPQKGACTEMVYGGCNGNENNFESEQECNNFCTARDICFQPKKIGMCRSAFPRFYFDSATRECKNFLYGGCDGNVNNFATLTACERKCADYLDDKTDVNIGDGDEEENVCELNPEKGSCRGYNIKWYYSSSRNRCARFVFTGCDGNGNRFDSEDECKGKCMRTDMIRPTRRPPYTRRPTYSTTTTTTTTTPAPTTTTSTTRSNVIPRQYSCNLPSDYGPCHDYKIKWYFNTDDRRCLRFYYGGCGGNDNRFESRAECEDVCVRGIAQTTTTTSTTERPYVYACTYSRFGCCNDGVTSAVDVRRSNCPENQGGGSGGDVSSVLVPIGTDAILVCPVQIGEITWYRDGFLLRSDRRFQIYDNGTLIVRRVSADMAGNYACRISNGNTIPQLERFRLLINEPLSIVPGPALASVKPGEDAFLHCQALGNPAPRVHWERNGRMIRSDSRHNVFANGTLIISGTNFADEGEYVCSAENGVSQPVNRAITLSLRESIEADIESHQGVYMEGDTIRLSCRGEGYPPPQIEWEKEGNMIKGNNRITVNGGDLIVRSASIEDAGMYKCMATNERATASDFTTVQIKLQTPQAKCEDTMRHTKCHLIVTGRLCGFRMFANKCCKSCRRAGYV